MAVIPGRPPHCSSVTSVYLVVAIRFLAKNILRAVLKSASTLGGVPMTVPPCSCWKVSAHPSARLPLKSNLSVVPTGRPKALGRPRSLQCNKTA